jgi:hypothetical protein
MTGVNRKFTAKEIAESGNRKELLEWLRNELVSELAAQRTEHEQYCDCSCSEFATGDAKAIASLAGKLMDVIKLLESGVGESQNAESDTISELGRRRAQRIS